MYNVLQVYRISCLHDIWYTPIPAQLHFAQSHFAQSQLAQFTFAQVTFCLVQVCLVTFCLGIARACFLPIAKFCQKLNIFKLNQLNFNESNVIGLLNCILYRLYLYLSLFILFLNLFCGFNFQQLVGKAMVILIPVPHGKPCRYHGSHFHCVSRSDWFIEN